MTEKELKRLGRRELIEMIATMKKTELELRNRLERAEKQLADRTIQISNAGSIAEAALSLNGVFEAAQAAADTYLQSLHAANTDIEARMAQAEEERLQLLREAENEALARIQVADKQCADKLAATELLISKRWESFNTSAQKVLQSRSELSEYLHK